MHSSQHTAALTMAALGIIYGDIGTSPLYAMNEVFGHATPIPHTAEAAAGVASVIFWMLILVVGIKYAIYALRADHEGEGGVFALFSIVQQYTGRHSAPLAFLLMFSAGLLFGEGIITPAISILSAVEGLHVAMPSLTEWIVPIALLILTGVFVFQRFGTARIGHVYGPIMALWFGFLAWSGLGEVMRMPSIFGTIMDPRTAISFMMTLPFQQIFFVAGTAFLSVTGSEALYADLGHLGKRAIRIGWFGIVFPALLLNYAGQAAYIARGAPIVEHNIFYSMVPASLAPFALILATMAAVIASVALIFGIYSLMSQAIALSIFPRLRVLHTDKHAEGRIYIPAVNWALYGGSALLIVGFGSASRLAAAYGFAVAGVMLITSITLYIVARHHWQWHPLRAAALFAGFIAMDAFFVIANSAKFFDGGFIPFLLGCAAFCVIATWRWGRAVLKAAYAGYVADRDMAWFLALKERVAAHGGVVRERRRAVVEADRAVVFLISRPIRHRTDKIPVKLRVFLKRRGTIPKNMLLLNVEQTHHPFVTSHYEVTHFGHGVSAVHAVFGFMEHPDVSQILHDLYHKEGLFDRAFRRCTLEASEDEIIIDADVPWRRRMLMRFFRSILLWSVPRYRYFGITGYASAGLSKTVVPVRLSCAGVRVEIPEFPLAHPRDRVDPDTDAVTNIAFVRI